MKWRLPDDEADIEAPHESALFANYPTIQADHHALDFICDYLRLMVGGNLNPFQIEALMDQEIDTHHHEAEQPAMFCNSPMMRDWSGTTFSS